MEDVFKCHLHIDKFFNRFWTESSLSFSLFVYIYIYICFFYYIYFVWFGFSLLVFELVLKAEFQLAHSTGDAVVLFVLVEAVEELNVPVDGGFAVHLRQVAHVASLALRQPELALLLADVVLDEVELVSQTLAALGHHRRLARRHFQLVDLLLQHLFRK